MLMMCPLGDVIVMVLQCRVQWRGCRGLLLSPTVTLMLMFLLNWKPCCIAERKIWCILPCAPVESGYSCHEIAHTLWAPLCLSVHELTFSYTYPYMGISIYISSNWERQFSKLLYPKNWPWNAKNVNKQIVKYQLFTVFVNMMIKTATLLYYTIYYTIL